VPQKAVSNAVSDWAQTVAFMQERKVCFERHRIEATQTSFPIAFNSSMSLRARQMTIFLEKPLADLANY